MFFFLLYTFFINFSWIIFFLKYFSKDKILNLENCIFFMWSRFLLLSLISLLHYLFNSISLFIYFIYYYYLKTINCLLKKVRRLTMKITIEISFHSAPICSTYHFNVSCCFVYLCTCRRLKMIQNYETNLAF